MKANILVIDDQEFFLKRIHNLIEDLNVNIFEAQSAKDGINILSTENIDLILSDVHMPDMNGFEAAKIIRKNDKTKDIPIIFITADEQNNDLNKLAIGYGGIDFLHKSKIKDGIKRLINLYLRFINREKILNKDLKQAIDEKDRFFSIIAHDLKSPFTGFMGFLSLLKSDLMNMSINEIIDSINDIDKSANNLFELLENLLEWSKLKQGLHEVKIEPQNLSKAVEKVFELAKLNSDAKNVTLSNYVKNDLSILADSIMLLTVLRNLVMNAIKFVKEGGKVDISAHETINGFVSIYVEDNGVGMSQEVQKKIFQTDNSYSTYGTNGESGTGLGVILCDELIKSQGGKLGVESKEGTGTKFFFILPKA